MDTRQSRFQPIVSRKQTESPIAIPHRTPKQISYAVKQNLSDLKLSVMSDAAIKVEADRVAVQYGVPKKAKREFYKICKSKKRRGKEIVKSVATLSSSMNWMEENENRGTGIDTFASRIRRRSPPK